MAVLNNTFRTTDAVGNREDLSDVVSRITPEDTPIYSMAGKEKAKSFHPEWEIDTLRSPAENAQEEGDDYAFNTIVAPTRVGNYTQIFRESWIISGTQENVDEAGNVQKRKYQKLKKGIEVRKDIEFAIVSNTASVAGATRFIGSLPSWITTNVSRGAGGVNGGYSSGTGLTVAATNGTQRAFTKAILDSVVQAGYNAGANFSDLVVSPYVKSVFVTFMSDTNVAAFRYAADGRSKNTIISNADIYEGPFGKLMVRPNRVMATLGRSRAQRLLHRPRIPGDEDAAADPGRPRRRQDRRRRQGRHHRRNHPCREERSRPRRRRRPLRPDGFELEQDE